MSVVSSIDSSISSSASLPSPSPQHRRISPGCGADEPDDQDDSGDFIRDRASTEIRGSACVNDAVVGLQPTTMDETEFAYDDDFEDDEDHLDPPLNAVSHDDLDSYGDSFEEDDSDLHANTNTMALDTLNDKEKDVNTVADPTTNVAPSYHGKALHHPDVSTANEWARSKLHSLRHNQAQAATEAKLPASTSKPIIPTKAVSHLMSCLHREKKPVRRRCSTSHIKTCRVPNSLVERARSQQLLALTSQPPIQLPVVRRERRSRPLSTFCSVKIGDLEGKLATTRLSDMLARWQTVSESDHTLSRGTLEFLASSTKRQRQLIRDSSSDDTEFLFAALKTHATSLDRAVQLAADAVADSRKLRDHAESILQARDAHACTCQFTGTSPRHA